MDLKIVGNPWAPKYVCSGVPVYSKCTFISSIFLYFFFLCLHGYQSHCPDQCAKGPSGSTNAFVICVATKATFCVTMNAVADRGKGSM